MPTKAERQAMIDKLREFPARLELLVKDLSHQDLTVPFLVDEWTVAQNVHHLADSHMNAFIRHKKIIFEDNPTLQGYEQADWATSADANHAALEESIMMLKGLHARWVRLFESLQEADWARTGKHAEYGETTLDQQLVIYAEHCDAHIDQITRTLAAKETR